MDLGSIWYREGSAPWPLVPLSWVYCGLVGLRRRAYRYGWLTVDRVDAPVVVVGNISVGGTGKTPLLIWLAHFLKSRGWRPGILSRGYRGRSETWPRQVTASCDPALVGDEPVLLARRAGCPVWVGSDRVAAARALLADARCDILLSDDGMQHYAMGRDVEIAVVDGARRHGNGACLPAGPLREPVSRLREVDAVVCNGGLARYGEFLMALRPRAMVNLGDPSRSEGLEHLSGREVVGVCGIGNPRRFFDQLRALGMQVIERPFPDHHPFVREDLPSKEPLPVIMTEKDAVKCERFASPNWWFLPVEAELDVRFAQRLDEILKGLKDG